MSLPFQFYLKLSDHMGQVNFSSQLYVLLCGLDPFPIFQALMKVIWGIMKKQGYLRDNEKARVFQSFYLYCMRMFKVRLVFRWKRAMKHAPSLQMQNLYHLLSFLAIRKRLQILKAKLGCKSLQYVFSLHTEFQSSSYKISNFSVGNSKIHLSFSLFPEMPQVFY